VLCRTGVGDWGGVGRERPGGVPVLSVQTDSELLFMGSGASRRDGWKQDGGRRNDGMLQCCLPGLPAGYCWREKQGVALDKSVEKALEKG